jgi:hypothetical protein
MLQRWNAGVRDTGVRPAPGVQRLCRSWNKVGPIVPGSLVIGIFVDNGRAKTENPRLDVPARNQFGDLLASANQLDTCISQFLVKLD